MNVWNGLSEWYMAHTADPLFQLLQGVVLGIVIAAGVALIKAGLKQEAEDERVDKR